MAARHPVPISKCFFQREAMQTNQTIFVVLSAHDHECASAVKAFFSKEAATAFANECGVYDTTVEYCPEVEDSAENDALWDAWTLRNDAWNKAHPAGEYGQADRYSVYEIQIADAALLQSTAQPDHCEDSLGMAAQPAQDVEASMIKLPEPVAWLANYGGTVYTEAQLKQAVRDALDALKDVAQTLAWTQHGECRGFSDGLLTTDEALDKARTALSKYKGAK